MKGVKCALCRQRPASPQSEHILPQWFLERFPPTKEPLYQVEINGLPVMKRDGRTPRRQNNIGAYKLPCCTVCNGVLSQRFETKQTRAVVRRLYDSQGLVTADAGDARALGLWLVKTWLLLSHPEARPSADHARTGWVAPNSLFAWTTNGADPPSDLSMWIYRQGTDVASAPHSMLLPTLISGRQRHPVQQNGLCVQQVGTLLLHHPGWNVEHPLEAAGTAVRLWPLPDAATLDTRHLAVVGRNPIQWVPGPSLTLKPGWTLKASRNALPALGSDMNEPFWADNLLVVSSAVIGVR